MVMPIDQIRRWARQIRLPEIGLDGQEKLAAARVAIVGVGGLGSPAALYLAAAGVGTLGLIDDDAIDQSNLQRQILFTEADIGQRKVMVAGERLVAANSELQLDLHPVRLTAENAMEILADYDIVVDGNDNFPTRYAVNDACVLLGKPNVYGSVQRFEGRVSLFVPDEGPCYRCLHPEPPPPGTVPSCEEAGVLGVLPGVIGTLQATEAIKWICGIGHSLAGRLLVADLMSGRFDEIGVQRNTDCAVCGENPTISEPVSYAETCDDTPEDVEPGDDYDLPDRITPRIAARRRENGEEFLILDVREPFEFAMAFVPNSLLIPLGELTDVAEDEIGSRRDDEILVLCHHGIRSAMAADWLRGNGFKRVKNIDGGIDRWSTDAAPSIPRY